MQLDPTHQHHSLLALLFVTKSSSQQPKLNVMSIKNKETAN